MKRRAEIWKGLNKGYRKRIKYNKRIKDIQKEDKKLSLIAQLCLTLCNPMDCSLPGSSVHGDSLGKNTEVSCHALLQGIFLSQGSNSGLPHCGQIHYHLSHQGSPTRN